jgi:hypothetical protein
MILKMTDLLNFFLRAGRQWPSLYRRRILGRVGINAQMKFIQILNLQSAKKPPTWRSRRTNFKKVGISLT